MVLAGAARAQNCGISIVFKCVQECRFLIWGLLIELALPYIASGEYETAVRNFERGVKPFMDSTDVGETELSSLLVSHASDDKTDDAGFFFLSTF
jgi:hypothetical protein